MKTLACVSPLIYHSLVTSMKIRKQKTTSSAPPSCIPDASFLTCGEQLHQQGEMKHSWQRKGQNWSVSSFWDIICLFWAFHSWLCVVLCAVRRGVCPCEGERLRVLTRRTPGLSQHQLHICSLVVDTLMTLADPSVKTLIKKLSSSSSLFHTTNRLHMGH